MSDALSALQRRREEGDPKLERLRLAVRQGVAALDRGEFTDVEDDELDDYLDDLAASPNALIENGLVSALWQRRPRYAVAA